MKKFAFIAILVSVPGLYGQAPDTLWTKTYGGDRPDYGLAIQECNGNGYIIAGWSTSFGGGDGDAYLVRINNDGDKLWSRTFGGGLNDFGNDIYSLGPEGYVIVGTTESFGNGGSDIYLFKVDTTGNLSWFKTFGGEDDEEGYAVQGTHDNGFILAGWTRSFGAGNCDIYIIKTDSLGSLEWTKTYGGVDTEYAYSVSETQDRGFIIAGLTCSYGAGGSDLYLIRTDSLGNVLWTRTYGRPYEDAGYSVKQTKDGGFITSGFFTWSLLGAEIAVLKTDPRGNLQWEYYNGSLSDDCAYAVQELSQGGYIIAGNFSGELYLIRLDSTGSGLWSKILGGAGIDRGYGVLETAEHGYIIAGITNSFGSGHFDVYVVKTATDPTTIREDVFMGLNPEAIKISPNPFMKNLKIKCEIFSYGSIDIYDVKGSQVRSFKQLKGKYQVIWDGKDFNGHQVPAGVYFVKIKTRYEITIKKIIKLR